jgi:hypothetical protein
VYDITFDLPDAGLMPGTIPPVSDAKPATGAAPPHAPEVPDKNSRRYPARSCRSVVGNQSYDTYAPRMQFLQLGEVRTHRSALTAMANGTKTTPSKAEQLHTTTSTIAEIDSTEHAVDAELTTESEDKMAVWGYLMTQYNLKLGLRRFGKRGTKAAVSELTQLHIMDTWAVMDPQHLTREDKAKALSSLLFLEEKRCGKSRDEPALTGHRSGHTSRKKKWRRQWYPPNQCLLPRL